MGKAKKINATVLPTTEIVPQLGAAQAHLVPEPEDVARFNRVLLALGAGMPLKEAAAAEGFSASYLPSLLGRVPELMVEVKAAREGYRELALLLTTVETFRRVDEEPDELTARDLTDLLRSLKPFDQASVQRFEVDVSVKRD